MNRALLLTADEMRRLDRLTIDGGHAAGALLMERAGAGVVAAMERRYGPLLALRALVLCGPGNNGGDGFVAARQLRARGAEPHVVLLGDPARITGDARHHLEALRAAGLEPVVAADAAALDRAIAVRDGWDLALDALLGTGAHGEPTGTIAAGVERLRVLDDAGTPVIAVDLPTGLDADTGAIARRAVRADLTVTFGHAKRGHLLYPGRAFCGALEVVDIGLVAPPDDPEAWRVELADEGAMARLLPVRDPRAHKNSVGRVLVIGGSPGLTGAVALAARAASRSGAGYVQLGVPSSMHDLFEIKLTEEMTLPFAESPARTLSLAALPDARAALDRVDAAVLGSGLSRHRSAASLVTALATQPGVPLVIDADALGALAAAGATATPPGAAPRVLTPHLGEMERLTGVEAATIERTRIDAAREWARAWDAVVVLKGAPTVTAAPDGRATVNPTGNPGLATAGSGDVLAGVVAALTAQGLAPYDAARLGAWAHGRAGDRVAETRGEHGLCAGDLLDALPAVLRALALRRDADDPR
jgi:ADP-dependent NAD(P)H-hydrate dehydratase / NAD(P)H-hydrate epimerase